VRGNHAEPEPEGAAILMAKVLFPGKTWFKLPLKLRQRWWSETDYGRLDPTPELMNTIEEVLKKQHAEPETEHDHCSAAHIGE
jgi:hypothetical protein